AACSGAASAPPGARTLPCAPCSRSSASASSSSAPWGTPFPSSSPPSAPASRWLAFPRLPTLVAPFQSAALFPFLEDRHDPRPRSPGFPRAHVRDGRRDAQDERDALAS